MPTQHLREEDRAFIRGILNDPESSAARLVYADWLDEHSDPRGRFLRVEVELAELPSDHPRRTPLRNELWELERDIDDNWIMLIDRPRIENCRPSSLRFAFECPAKWEKLRATEQDGVRFCDQCHKKVYFCRDVVAAGQHARLGDCVAITTLAMRREGDLEEEIRMDRYVTAGIVAIPEPSDRDPLDEVSSERLGVPRERRPWWKFW